MRDTQFNHAYYLSVDVCTLLTPQKQSLFNINKVESPLRQTSLKSLL